MSLHQLAAINTSPLSTCVLELWHLGCIIRSMLLYYRNKCWNTDVFPSGLSSIPQGVLATSRSQLQYVPFSLYHKERCAKHQSLPFNVALLFYKRPHGHQSNISSLKHAAAAALRWPCCRKWLFCIELPEWPGRVERLLYTNRPGSCYFSGDACLARHAGRNIDRLSLSMQSSRLEETLERQSAQGAETLI